MRRLNEGRTRGKNENNHDFIQKIANNQHVVEQNLNVAQMYEQCMHEIFYENHHF